jgi:hypothetical protein
MTGDLFDMKLRALRRDRAARLGPELFLHERTFEDCLERLESVRREFTAALLVGCPDPAWTDRLRARVDRVDVADPGMLFAGAVGGQQIVEDAWTPEPAAYDVCLAIGTLDTVNDLPRALLTLRLALAPDGLLLGALAGGDMLPRLRSAMRAADQVTGSASPHVHPRIEPAALAGLLAGAGFQMPVVDVDRVQVAYSSMERLIRDLRRMGGTNVLSQRSRSWLGTGAWRAAVADFGTNTVDTFEILHFAGWSPAVEEG